MVCLILKFGTGHNFPWYNIAHGSLSENRLIFLNTSSERPLSKLSENHKINVIGPTELKLWPFKVWGAVCVKILMTKTQGLVVLILAKHEGI